MAFAALGCKAFAYYTAARGNNHCPDHGIRQRHALGMPCKLEGAFKIFSFESFHYRELYDGVNVQRVACRYAFFQPAHTLVGTAMVETVRHFASVCLALQIIIAYF